MTGFAAGCEATALPRRCAAPFARAAPLVRVLPCLEGQFNLPLCTSLGRPMLPAKGFKGQSPNQGLAQRQRPDTGEAEPSPHIRRHSRSLSSHYFGCGFAVLRLGVSAVNVQPSLTKPQRYAEEVRAQQNYAGSGEIQEERVDVDVHNVFSAYAPRGSSKIWGTKHE